LLLAISVVTYTIPGVLEPELAIGTFTDSSPLFTVRPSPTLTTPLVVLVATGSWVVTLFFTYYTKAAIVGTVKLAVLL
jgi:hypothetical protein